MMMMKCLSVLALLAALSTPALAQQQFTPEQAAAAALGEQIGLLSHENGVLRGQVQQLSAEVGKLKAENEKLKKPPEQK